MTRVKICGVTNEEDALAAVDAGADELGFNFCRESARYIEPDAARAIVEKLPEGVVKIGVFVNESLEKLQDVASRVRLDAVQLHGDEDVSYVETFKNQCGLSVIKAVRVQGPGSLAGLERLSADAILLDAYSPVERGGTGKAFDWSLAADLEPFKLKIYLAGGLTPENVAFAIRTVRPYAVDACSRLETEPGKKDKEKMRRFIAAAKEIL